MPPIASSGAAAGSPAARARGRRPARSRPAARRRPPASALPRSAARSPAPVAGSDPQSRHLRRRWALASRLFRQDPRGRRRRRRHHRAAWVHGPARRRGSRRRSGGGRTPERAHRVKAYSAPRRSSDRGPRFARGHPARSGWGTACETTPQSTPPGGGAFPPKRSGPPGPSRSPRTPQLQYNPEIARLNPAPGGR